MTDIMSAPALDGLEIPDAISQELPTPGVRSIYVATSGDLVVRTYQGRVVTLRSVPSGSIVPIVIKAVMPETTATGLVGLI